MTYEFFQSACAYLAVGLSVFPLPYGSKVPTIPWKQFQEARATVGQLTRWFKERQHNVGIIMGKVSGGTVGFDFDDPRVASRAFGDIAKLARLTYVSRTSRGFHVVVRVKGLPVKTTSFHGRGAPLDLKAEGGYLVAPPSLHPDGGRYELLSPNLRIAVIARSEFDALVQQLLRKQPPLPGLGVSLRHACDEDAPGGNSA